MRDRAAGVDGVDAVSVRCVSLGQGRAVYPTRSRKIFAP
jgi:hypothetical protein